MFIHSPRNVYNASSIYTLRVFAMRTNIDIDDGLMDAAMRSGPYSTKREAVEAGLQLLARKAAYRDILALRGQLQWDDGPTTTAPTASGATTRLVAHSPSPPPYVRPKSTRPKVGVKKASSK